MHRGTRARRASNLNRRALRPADRRAPTVGGQRTSVSRGQRRRLAGASGPKPNAARNDRDRRRVANVALDRERRAEIFDDGIGDVNGERFRRIMTDVEIAVALELHGPRRRSEVGRYGETTFGTEDDARAIGEQDGVPLAGLESQRFLSRRAACADGASGLVMTNATKAAAAASAPMPATARPRFQPPRDTVSRGTLDSRPIRW